MTIRGRVRSLLSRAMRWDSVAGWTTVSGATPDTFQRDGRTARLLGWQRHPVVNACARAIADLVAAVPFEVYKKFSDGTTDVEINNPLGDLLASPRGAESDYRHRSRTALHYLLFGNGFWYLERPGPRRPPERLRIIPPDHVNYVWMDPESDEIAAYNWTTLQGVTKDRTPVQDIVHFRDLDASDGLFGYPRFAAALSDIKADGEATEYVREIVTNHGQPGAIAKVKGYTSKSDLLSAEESFNERFQARGSRGRTFFMNVEDMELVPVGFTLADLEFPDLRRIAREDICAAANVDPRIIGIGSAAKDGGLSGEQYREARFRLIQQAVMPVMKAMESDINLWLAPEFGDVYVRFDPDVLSELTEDEAATAKRGLDELAAAAITVEEYRDLTGRDSDMDPSQHLAHSITVQWKTVEEADNPPEPAPLPMPGDATTPPPPPTTPRTRVMRRGDVLTPDERAALWRAFDEKASKLEASYHRTAIRRFNAESRDVVALVVAMDEGNRADPVMEALLRALLQRFADGGEYEQAWVRDYVRLLTSTFREAGNALSASIGVSFDVQNPRVQAAIRNRADKLAEFVTTETAKQVQAVIEQGRAGGLGIRDIAAQLKETVYGDDMTDARATRIARTETVGAMNEGEYQTAVVSGVMQSKEWLTQGDNRVRDTHEALDGVRIPIGKAFANGAQHPGDRNAGPSETINCRCTLLFYDEEAPA